MAEITTKRLGHRKSNSGRRNNRRRLSMTTPAMEMLEDRRMLAIDFIDVDANDVLQLQISGTESVNVSAMGNDLIVTGSGGVKHEFNFGGPAETQLKGIVLTGTDVINSQQLTISSNFSGLDSGIIVSAINNVTFQGELTGGNFDLQGSGFFSVTTSSGLNIGSLSANFGGNITFSADVTAESIDLVGRAFGSSGSVSVTTTGADGISIETTLGAINARGTYYAQGDGGISLTTPSKSYSIQTDNLQTDGGTLSAAGGSLWVYGTLDTDTGAIDFDGLEGSVTLSKGLTAGSLSAVGVAGFSANGTNPVTINGGDLTIEALNGSVRFQGAIETNGGNVSLETPLAFRDVRVRSVDTDGGDFYVKSGSFYNNSGDTLDAGTGDIVLEVASNIGLNGPVTTGSFEALGTNSFRGQFSFSITASTGDIRIDSLVQELLAGGRLETTSPTGGIYLNSSATQRTIVSDLKTAGGNIVATGNNFQTTNGNSIETNGGHFDLSGHTGHIQIYGGVNVGSLDATDVASFTYSTNETLMATEGDIYIKTTSGAIQITADIEAEGNVSLIAPMSQFVRIRAVETQGGDFVVRGREFRNENGNTIVTNGGDINIHVAELALIRGDVLTDGGDICLTADTLNASTAGVSFDTSGGYATFNVGTANIAGTLDTDGGTLNISLAPTAPNFYPEGSPVLFTVGQGDIVFNDGSILAIDPYKMSVTVGDKFDLVRAANGEIINVDDTLQVLSVGLDKAGNDVTFAINALGPNGINSGERLQVIADSSVEGTAKDITAFGPGNYRIVRDDLNTADEEDDFILLYRDCLLIMRRPVELVSSVDVIGGDGSDDTFTIDLSGGNPIVDGGVSFDGLGGFDQVFLINGNPETTIYDYLDETSGTIEIIGVSPDFGANEGIFSYTNVQQINDENVSDYLEFYFTELDDDATLENSALGSQITAETFTNTLFTHPNISIFIDGLEGDDIINIGQESGTDYVLPGVDLIIESVGDDVQMNVDFLSGGSFIIDAGTFTAFEDTAFNLDGSALFDLTGDLTAEGEGDRTFIASSFDISAANVNFNNANLLATGEDGILLVSTEGDITTGNIEASFAGAAITLTAEEDANVSSVTTNDGAFNVTGVNLFVDEVGVINTGTGAWNITVTENFEVLASPSEFEVEELHFEGFEDPAWTSGQTDNWQGAAISRVPTTTNGIDSFEGSAHAVLASGGPFTRFGGYRTDFGLGFTASLAVYLDPAAFEIGDGFDYSVAANRQDGNHLRDFIFHVGNVGGQLLVNASNNTDNAFNAFKLTNENGGNNHTISTAGWYTLEHVFRNDGGALAVDFNLRNSDGDVVYTVTRSTPADDIATIVGGNRYGWMIFNDVEDLAIDNTQLTTLEAIPARTHIGGDITVSAANMILEDSSITASGDVDIDVSGSVTMLDLETTGAGATIDINAGDSITLADLSAVDGTTTILAVNDIVIDAISTVGGDLDIESLAASVTTAAITTVGGTVDITAATDITVGGIDTSGEDGGTITLVAGDNISTGDLTSQDANITLDAGGEILSGNGVTGGGDYWAVATNNVTVGDVTSLGGDIYVESLGGSVITGDLDSSGSGGDVTLFALAGTVTAGNITTGGGNLLIEALGAILVGMINTDGNDLDPGDGTVDIESTAGSVTTGSILSFGAITVTAADDITIPALETTGSAAAISLFGDADALIGSVTTVDGAFNVAGVAPGTLMQNLVITADGIINTGTGTWNIDVTGNFEVELLSAPQFQNLHFEGFEDPGWAANLTGNWQNFTGGEIEKVLSGNAGIPSYEGDSHAIITIVNNGSGAPFTQFGGYSSEFGRGYATSLHVYLDPVNWTDGDGFDFSSAVNNQAGSHLRDFIAHIGMVDGSLLFNGSNNSDLIFNGWKLVNENGGNNYTIGAAGWYAIEHVFYDNGGVLSVDINLRDADGDLLFTVTRDTADDIATTVGGNRYGWLVYNNIDGLAVDNTRLFVASRQHIGGEINVNAGSVVLPDSSILASGDVDINVTGSVTMLDLETTGAGATIDINAGDSITLADLSAVDGTTTILAVNDIVIDAISTVGGDLDIESEDASVTTGPITTVGGSVDVLADTDITIASIDTSGVDGGTINLEAGDNISTGDLTSKDANITLDAGGEILSGNGVTGGGNYIAFADGNVTVGDVTSLGGDIDLTSVNGDVTHGNLDSSGSGGDITILAVAGSVTGGNITTGGGDLLIDALGNILVGMINTDGLTPTNGTVLIESEEGSVTTGSIISFGDVDIYAALDINTGDLTTTGAGSAISLFGDQAANIGSVTTNNGDFNVAGVAPGTKMQNLLISADGVINTGSGDWNIELSDTLSTGVAYFEGFSDPNFVSADPADGLDGWNNRPGGKVARVVSGTNDIDSLSGSSHGIITDLANATVTGGDTVFGGNSVFTKYDGYRSTHNDGFSTAIAIFLDPAWDNGQGFDFSVAANNQSGTYLTEAIFNVGVIDDELRVNGGSGSPWQFNPANLPAGDSAVITAAGWYTFEHVFYDSGDDTLAIDLNLLNEAGDLIYSTTLNRTSSVSNDLGGNRYGWFTYNNIEGLAIDNVGLSLSSTAAPRTHVGGNVTINAGTVALANDEIVASGDLTIETDSGSITAGGLETTGAASTLWVTAETSLTVGSLTSNGGNIEAYTELGDMLLGTVASNGGDILLDSGNDLTVGTATSTGGDITLEAVGDITFGTIDSSGSGGDVSIGAGGMITGGDITTGGGELTMNAGGDIMVGEIDANDVVDEEGTVSIESAGSVTTGNILSFGDVDILAGEDITTGNITANGGDVTALAAADVTVADVTTNGGNITLIADSDGDDDGTLTHGNLSSGGGNISLEGANIVDTANQAVDTAGGDFIYLSGGSYTVSTITTVGGKVSIDVTGNFTFDQIDTTGTPDDGDVSIIAGGFVLGLLSPSINAGDGNLAIKAGGDVTTQALSASKIQIDSGDAIGVTGTIMATNLVSLDANSSLNVSGMITSTGNNVVIEAGGDVEVLGTIQVSQGALLVGQTTAVGMFNAVNLTGGKGIYVNSASTLTAGDITTSLNDGNVEILAAGDIELGSISVTNGAEPGNVTVSTTGGSILTNSIWSQSEVSLTATGSISSGGASITSQVGDIVIQTAGAVTTGDLTAMQGEVLVGTDTNKVGSLTADEVRGGSGVTIESAGAVEVDSLRALSTGDISVDAGGNITVDQIETQNGAGHVDVTTGGTFTATSTIVSAGDVAILAAGAIATQAIEGAGDIGVNSSGGTINIDGSLLVNIFSGGGITLSANGNVSTSSDVQSLGTGGISVNSGEGSIDIGGLVLVSNSGTGISLTAKQDITTSSYVRTNGTGGITVASEEGAIGIGSYIRAHGAAGGEIALSADGNITTGSYVLSNGTGNISFLSNGGVVSVGGVIDGNAAVSVGTEAQRVGSLTSGDVIAGTTVDVYAGGAIQTGAVTGPDGITLDSTSGAITTNALTASGTGDIEINTTGNVTILGNSVAAGSFTIGKPGDISALPPIPDVPVGQVSTQNVTAGGLLAIIGDGGITTGTLISNNGIVYVISENGDLTINGNVTSKNELALVAEGNLEAGNLTSTDHLVFAWIRDTPGGEIDLGNINGALDVSVLGNGSVETGAITTTSKIGVSSVTGPITVSGNVTAGGAGNNVAFLSTDGSITIQGSVNTTGASFLAQTINGGVTLDGAVNTQGGELTINSNENIAYASFDSDGGEIAILSKTGGLSGGDVLADTGEVSITTETDIQTGEITGSEITLDSANGNVNVSSSIIATGGTVTVLATEGTVSSGTISGADYVLDAKAYTITGDLSNTNGAGSSVALHVDAALINDDTFAQLLTVSETWTLALGTNVNVNVTGTIDDPANDLPLVIASATTVDNQGANISPPEAMPVDDLFSDFDGNNLWLYFDDED